MPLRTYVPNPTTRTGTSATTALKAALFAFEIAGALVFAIGTTALLARHTSTLAAVPVAGLFTFAYALVGMGLLETLE